MRHSKKIFVAFLVLSSFIAQAQLVVNDAGNQSDINPGDGICETGVSNGICTLRAAIEEANALAGANSIDFSLASGTQITIDSELTLADNATSIDADLNGDGRPDIILASGNAGISGFIITGANNSISGFNLVQFTNGIGFPAAIKITGATATGNIIASNYIGTDLGGGAIAFPGNYRAIRIDDGASNNQIGDGTPTGVNVISNNQLSGIQIADPTSINNRITGNIIGLDASGTVDLGNSDNGIEITNATGTIIGLIADGRNILSGNGSAGIELNNAPNTRILNNYIGTSLDGNADLGNDNEGITILGTSDGSLIGDGSAGNGNLISGNSFIGVLVGSPNISVLGNIIGLNAAGNAVIQNSNIGLDVAPGATNTIIGNGTANGRNIISGNSSHGVRIREGSNSFEGNYVGLGADGVQLLGNIGIGVFVTAGTDTYIGGNTAGAGNVISGNATGVSLSTGPNFVYGNIIGLDATATIVKPNTNEGVRITANGDANEIGDGTFAGANIIAGNTDNGVLLSGLNVTGNGINVNYIGTNPSGADLGNGLAGVRLEAGASGNSVPENIIAFNQTGILATGNTTQLNLWTQNSIYSNTTGISIEAGAQGGVAPPVITAVPVDGMITGTAEPNALVDIYADAVDQGEYLFGVALADASGNWTCTCLGPISSLPPGLNFITATQTDQLTSNSSAFSLPFALPPSALPFVTTWKTDNPGSSNNDQITIPHFGGGSNYDIYWEEAGNPTNNGTATGIVGTHTITFPNPGTYRVEITGAFFRIYFNNTGDNDKILTVEQWGDISWTSMSNAFRGCSNLTVPAVDAPNLSGVTDLTSMFNNCTSLTQSLDHWDVSTITTMRTMFFNASAFNGTLSSWNVSAVIDFSQIFEGATLFDQALPWTINTSLGSGVNMRAMFSRTSFNQDLSGWDVREVVNMSNMFAYNPDFNGNINSWDVRKVTNFSLMFRDAPSFNQDISGWRLNSALFIQQMFLNATSFNQPIGNWGTSTGSITDMSGTFRNADAFNQSIDAWDVSSVTNMDEMFTFSDLFNQDLNSWDMSSVQSVRRMFWSSAAFNGNIADWNLSSCIFFNEMFLTAQAFDQPLNWTLNTNAFANIQMNAMFEGSIFNQDISSWNVSRVQNMDDMFYNNTVFNGSVDGWDPSNVQLFRGMFRNATSFNQSLGSWNISSAVLMDNMLLSSGMSVANYDATLIGWNSLPSLQSGVNFGAGGLSYCLAETARNNIISTYGWSISDAGLNCPADMLYTSIPTPNAIGVNVNSDITLDFDTDIDLVSVHNNSTNANEVYDDNIIITGNQSGQIEGTYLVGGDNSIIVFTPTISFKAGEKITVNVSNLVTGTGGEAANSASFSFLAASGPFEGAFLEKLASGIVGVTYGATDYGDYDNDGDIDLIVVGWDDPSYDETARIYNNVNGVFTDLGAGLTGVYYSDADWGDYDGDGNLDLIVAGNSDALGVNVATIYRNDGIGNFTDIGAGLQGVDYASVNWGDFDNDGDIDLAVSGRYNTGTGQSSTIIYQNDGGSFTDIGAGLIGLSNGSADWVDYDADGDLDLFVTGADVGSVRYATLYRNDGGGIFVDSGAGLPGVEFSAADWGDYDNDGDLDLVMMGGQSSGTNDGVYIYQNNAGIFTNINAGFSDRFEDGSTQWGDFDGDGDLDLALTGQDYEVSEYVTRIYRNDGGVFNLLIADLVGVAEQSTGNWGDFDGDGDLDLLLTGVNSRDGNPSAIIYENTLPPFITTWITTDGQITIPTTGGGYDYSISWTNLTNPGNGEGALSGRTGSTSIFGLTNGDTYQVVISGSFPRFFLNDEFSNAGKIVSIEQWGGIQWQSMADSFTGARNLVINAADTPDLSQVTSLRRMFQSVRTLNAFDNTDLSLWDVSTITDMSYLFYFAWYFNQDISNWDVSNVTTFQYTFAGTISFNQPLEAWVFPNATTMSSMFDGSQQFNQPLNLWDVSAISDMSFMFFEASGFNQPLNGWNVSAVTNMSYMFYDAIFDQPLNLWDVSAVTDMSYMFNFAQAFNQPINDWDVSSVSNMEGMFYFAQAFNQPLNNWDVSNVTNMFDMFDLATAFNQSLGNWDISNVTDMSFMLDNSGLSTANYDATLIGWSALPSLQSSVTLGAAGINYCVSEIARDDIVSLYDWTFLDAGLLCTDINGVTPGDYNALVALYNATDGPNWTNRTNWLTAADVSTWFGVVTTGNRVSQVNLGNNNLVGTLPPEIGNLDATIFFRVNENTISGTIPVETGNMSSMIQLWLYDNQLTGTIPIELGNMTTMSELRLDQNQLTGTIPSEIGDLPNLWLFFVYNNDLTGSIPITAANFPALTALDVNNNMLSGPIPPAIMDHITIDYLLMGGNDFTGSIPASLSNLTGLEYLQLHSNQLTGSIPTELGSLSSLIQLYLYNNQLTGSIPAELGNLNSLEQFLLNQNQLSGSIPIELGNLSNVLRFRLHTNQLTGAIPTELGNLNALTELSLYTNQLDGAIPSELGNLNNLTSLRLFDNQLSGNIPTSLGNLTNLIDFRLEQNQLTGTIPVEIGNLTNLTDLRFDTNMLSGAVPDELASLTLLTSLSLSFNTFADLPDLSSLINMTNMQAHTNNFEFDDLEPNIGITGIVYSPQADITGPGDQILSEGSTLDITVQIGGTANVYQWYKDDVILPGQTSNNLVIANVTDSDEGQYSLNTTNTLVPGLTLLLERFLLTVNPAPQEQLDIFEGTDTNGNPISVGQSNVDVGSTVIGVDIDRDFTIQNNESIPVSISSISSNDPAFEIINAPSTVAPGTTELFTVRLVADEIGQFTSSISINSNFAPFTYSVIGEVNSDEPTAGVTVFNAVSPNGDGKHDYLEIQDAELYPEIRVKIINRWGDMVYEASGYDNASVRFEGNSNRGGNAELPPGTYFYQIDFKDDTPSQSGFITLRR